MFPLKNEPKIQEATYRSEKSDKEKTWYVQITSGEYAECVFKYVDWRFVKTEVAGHNLEHKYHLQFKFILLHYPEKWKEPDGDMLDNTNKELMSLLGNILLELATEDFEAQKRNDDISAALANDDTIAFYLPTVSTQVPPMPTVKPPPRKL